MTAHVKIPPLDVAPSFTVGAAQAVFNIAFPFFQASDILVYVGGVLLDPSAYTVAGLFVQNGSAVVGGFGSGTVTLNVAVTNTVVVIDRQITEGRNTDFSSTAPFSQDQVNTDLDKLTARDSDINRTLARAPLFPQGSSRAAFPSPSGLNGLFLSVVAGVMTWVAAQSVGLAPLNGKVYASVYGTVGDNVTDDAAAITRAIAFANASPFFKTVVFDGVSYFVGSTITKPNNVALEGQEGTTFFRKTFASGHLVTSIGRGGIKNISAYHDYTGLKNIDQSLPATSAAIVNPCTSGYIFNIQTPTYSLFTNLRAYGGVKAVYTYGGAFCTFLACQGIGTWDPLDATMQLTARGWHEDGDLSAIPTGMQKINCIASGVLYSGLRTVVWPGNGPQTTATAGTFTSNGTNQITVSNATPVPLAKIVMGMVLTSGAVSVPAGTYVTGVNYLTGAIGLSQNISAGTFAGTFTGGSLGTAATATVTETSGSPVLTLASAPSSLGIYKGMSITAGNLTGYRVNAVNDGTHTVTVSGNAPATGSFSLTFSRQTVQSCGPQACFEISCCEGSSWVGGFLGGGALYNTLIRPKANSILKAVVIRDFQGDTAGIAALELDASAGTSPTDITWEPTEQSGQNCSWAGVDDSATTNLQGTPSVIGLRLGGTIVNMFGPGVSLQRAQAVTCSASMNVRGYNSANLYSLSDLQDMATGWRIGGGVSGVSPLGNVGGGSTGSDSTHFDYAGVISPTTANIPTALGASLGLTAQPGPGYPPLSLGGVPSTVNSGVVSGQNTTPWVGLSR